MGSMKRGAIPSCPVCGEPDLAFDQSGLAICPHCGTRVTVQADPCPRCGHQNAPGVETCLACGEPLSIAARVVERQAGARSQPWLDKVRSQASSLKEMGERASLERIRTLRMVDEVREAEQNRLSAARGQGDRKILTGAAIALGVMLLILAVFAAVNLL